MDLVSRRARAGAGQHGRIAGPISPTATFEADEGWRRQAGTSANRATKHGVGVRGKQRARVLGSWQEIRRGVGGFQARAAIDGVRGRAWTMIR